jgi:hypothetical protein
MTHIDVGVGDERRVELPVAEHGDLEERLPGLDPRGFEVGPFGDERIVRDASVLNEITSPDLLAKYRGASNSSIGSVPISPATADTSRSPFNRIPASLMAFAATRNAAIGPLSLTIPSP